jgi:hypothetical protein
MIFKLFGIVVTFIIGAILGLRISKDIENGVLYTLFWVLYAITYLTFANLIAIGLFYNILKSKTGPPGPRGPQGEPGDVGATGVCQSGCKQMECKRTLQDEVVKKINELAGNPVPPIQLKNLLLLNQISNLCTSTQFEKVAEMKGAEPATHYIRDIFNEWITLLYDAGGKEFFESPGAEDNFNWKNNKQPFKELEKYDIYYWKMNKLFKPTGVDVCEDPNVNRKIPQKDKPLLYTIETNVYDESQDKRSPWQSSTYKPRSVFNDELKYNMYPVGDVAVTNKHVVYGNGNDGPKYIDGMSVPQNGRDGPKKPSILIAGDATVPDRIEKNGNHWKMIPKKGYTCIGDIGGASPNKYNYRCIPTDCAERVSDNTYNGQFISLDPKGGLWGLSGSSSDGQGNEIGKKNYNLFRATGINNGHHEPFYKIKDRCLVSANPDVPEIGQGDWISHRWFGVPERDPKYSIFTFLGIVPEGVLTNKETSNHYYFISTNSPTDLNSYVIKYFNVGMNKHANMETAGNTNVGINYTNNYNKKEQLWYLEYTDPNQVHIRSKKTNKYMGLHRVHSEGNREEKNKHILKILQYDRPYGNRTSWKIKSTTTGQKKVPQTGRGR